MRQEDKQLLLKDLCARLPYGVKIYTKDGKNDASFTLKISDLNWIFKDDRIDEMYEYDGWKPYLRPISSMTKEEEKEYAKVIVKSQDCSLENNESATTMVNDWYLSKGFDVRGLIPKGFALEAPEGVYNLKEK